MAGGQEISWAANVHEIIGLLRPFATLLSIVLAFWLFSKASNEKPTDVLREVFSEFGSLTKGKRDLKSTNALILLAAAFLIFVIFATPLSEIALQAKESSADYDLARQGLISLLIVAFMIAGLISMKISKFEN
jgi:hypothetical protein